MLQRLFELLEVDRGTDKPVKGSKILNKNYFGKYFSGKSRLHQVIAIYAGFFFGNYGDDIADYILPEIC